MRKPGETGEEELVLVEELAPLWPQYLLVQAEIAAAGEQPSYGFDAAGDCGAVMKSYADRKAGRDLPPGEVTRQVYWLVRRRDGRLLGVTNIRGLEKEFFAEAAGNIGYGIRPTERGKGYATRMLALALEKCRAMGMERALVTCSPENPASARVIQKNGGVYERDAQDRRGRRYRRYWIALRP